MVVDELARQYQKLGHSVVMLSPEPPREIEARDEEFPYRIERHPRFVSTRWFVSWYELALKRLYREFKYDIIHCHNVYPNGYLAVKHKLRGGPPVVITSHGGDVRVDNPRFKKPGLRARHRFAVQQADALVAIGPFTEKGYLDLGASPRAIHSIGNGVHSDSMMDPVKRPDTIPAHLQPKKFVLFVGRLANRKGVDVLLRAAAKQLAAMPVNSPSPHFVICGDGAERESLEALSVELGVSSFVTFMGNVRGMTKQWLLQNAYAMVIPSRQWEAYPMVLLEGFAVGCPVIASDAPGLEGLVEDHETGWVFPRENPAALAQILDMVWQSPSMATQVGQNGLRVARQCDWARIAEKHVELFERITGQQKQFKLRIAS
ncbi:MAG TPA: glycosyltransferase family 4 protein [Gemmatales bacterium]|nr:glycosyltransferase family 4 protein [Gemmatales bacterium]